jgi:hypothetical protein
MSTMTRSKQTKNNKVTDNIVADSQNNTNNNKLSAFIDTLTNSKLVESKAAAEYISAMCELVRRQYPYYTNEQIRYRISTDCNQIFSQSVINASWPQWVLED